MASYMPQQVVYFDRTKTEECPYEKGLMINPTVQHHCDMVLITESHISFQHYEKQIKVVKNIPLEDLYQLDLYKNNGELISS
jgi:peptide deformylase